MNSSWFRLCTILYLKHSQPSFWLHSSSGNLCLNFFSDPTKFCLALLIFGVFGKPDNDIFTNSIRFFLLEPINTLISAFKFPYRGSSISLLQNFLKQLFLFKTLLLIFLEFILGLLDSRSLPSPKNVLQRNLNFAKHVAFSKFWWDS